LGRGPPRQLPRQRQPSDGRHDHSLDAVAGGDLEIAVDDDLEVTMTGPAVEVYRGELSADLARALEEL
jgi:hypothetical protein